MMMFASVALLSTVLSKDNITHRKKAPLAGFGIILLNNVNGWLLAAKSSDNQQNLFGT